MRQARATIRDIRLTKADIVLAFRELTIKKINRIDKRYVENVKRAKKKTSNPNLVVSEGLREEEKVKLEFKGQRVSSEVKGKARWD